MIKFFILLINTVIILSSGHATENLTSHGILVIGGKNKLPIELNSAIKKEFKENFSVSSTILITKNSKEYTIASLNLNSKNSYSCGIVSYENGKLINIYAEPYCKWTSLPKIINQKNSLLINFPMNIKAYSDAVSGESSVEIKINTNTFEISF